MEDQVDRPAVGAGRWGVVGLLKHFAAGGVGGVLNVFAGHPLDTIKVRLQTQARPSLGQVVSEPPFRGTLDCAIKTVKLEGIRGLYKGMLSPLVMFTPLYAVTFFGYEVGKQLQQKKTTDQLTLPQYFNAGMVAGLFCVSVSTPMDRVKCLMQVQRQSSSKAQYSSTFDCARQVYRRGGLRNLYLGTTATIVRDVPGTGVHFLAYEWVRQLLTPEGVARDELGPGKVMLAGGMAGVAGWTSCIAPDTVKSRLQTAPDGHYRGARAVLKEMLRNEGVRALFTGFVPAVMRAFPAHAACFLGYEMSMRCFNWLLPPLGTANTVS